MTKALSDMTDEERYRHYKTASGPELIAAAAAEQEKTAAAKKSAARKAAPRRAVVNRAGAGESVAVQVGHVENGPARGAANKTARGGGRTTTFVNNGATVGVQGADITGATVFIGSGTVSSSSAPSRPADRAPAAPAKKAAPAPEPVKKAVAKKAAPPTPAAPAATKAAAKKVVKKAPAKKAAAAQAPTGTVKPDVAAAVAQVQADQAKRLAAEEKARKAAARAAARTGQVEQGPQVTGLPLPKTAAKKVVKKAAPPMTFKARHARVRRAIKLIRRKPHHALGIAALFLATGAVHVGIRVTRSGTRRAWAGLTAMGRGYDQYRRMARAAKAEHKHAGCHRCGGTGVVPLRGPDGSYAGSRSCPGR